MALIPICNTPTDGGNIGVSRSDDCSIAHGYNIVKIELNIDYIQTKLPIHNCLKIKNEYIKKMKIN